MSGFDPSNPCNAFLTHVHTYCSSFDHNYRFPEPTQHATHAFASSMDNDYRHISQNIQREELYARIMQEHTARILRNKEEGVSAWSRLRRLFARD
jgi:hypothetical protein